MTKFREKALCHLEEKIKVTQTAIAEMEDCFQHAIDENNFEVAAKTKHAIELFVSHVDDINKCLHDLTKTSVKIYLENDEELKIALDRLDR